MLITKQEVRELEALFEWMDEYRSRTFDFTPAVACSGFFARRPHLLMPLGFDEYVGFRKREQYKDWWFAPFAKNSRFKGAAIFRQPRGQWYFLSSVPVTRTGAFCFADKNSMLGRNKNAEFHAVSPLFVDLLKTLSKLADDEQPTSEERIWSPALWTPYAQEEQRILLADSVAEILRSIRAEKVALADLSWKVLEDIVAEVLRRSGLDVYVVKDHPQGGRDIVARGELIPGQEPIQMAVEVKHKATVDRPDVQTALWQNRMYPTLLFVTSGRFTSGVLREKQLPENRLRLFLKDGIALGDLIRDYS